MTSYRTGFTSSLNEFLSSSARCSQLTSSLVRPLLETQQYLSSRFPSSSGLKRKTKRHHSSSSGCQDSDMTHATSNDTQSPLDLDGAAKSDEVSVFKALFERESTERIKSLLQGVNSLCPPLVMACRYTAHNIVDFLLKKFQSNPKLFDLNQIGTVPSFRQGKEVRGATALWVAAAGGSVDIVDMLLRLGASVNRPTATKSTPIRGAAFYGHLKVMTRLLEQGADVNLANVDGQSPLLVACAMGHLPVVQFLISQGAQRGTDISGLSEILMAAIYGHKTIFDYLVSLPDCSIHEHINGLELFGATLIDNHDDYNGALRYWREALELREKHGIAPLEYPNHPAYRGVKMPTSSDQFDLLSVDHRRMALLALCVRERVIGKCHPFTSHFVRFRAAVYCDQHDYEPSSALLLQSLELQHHSTTVPYSNFDTVSEVVSQAELLSDMVFDGYKPNIRPFLQWAIDDIQQCMEKNIDYSRMLSLCLSFLGIWLELDPPSVGALTGIFDGSNIDRRRLVQYLLHLESSMMNAPASTLLHLACNTKTTETGPYPPHRFPSFKVAEYLIHCGAKLNALNAERQMPLHLIASHQSSPASQPIIQCLLEAGAYMHGRDAKGRTPLDIARDDDQRGKCTIELQSRYMPNLTLGTLAAMSVIKYGLDYRGQIPCSLERFLALH